MIPPEYRTQFSRESAERALRESQEYGRGDSRDSQTPRQDSPEAFKIVEQWTTEEVCLHSSKKIK